MLDSKRIVYFLVGLGGAFVGILFSLITGCTLMEISFSPVFVVLMGLLFEAISVCFYYRIISIHKDDAHIITRIFAALCCTCILLSGAVCILVDGDKMIEFEGIRRAFMYGLIANSCLYILYYSVLDLISLGFFNSCSTAIIGSLDTSLATKKPLLYYPVLVLLISSLSFILGGLYGLLYGSIKLSGSATTRVDMFQQQWIVLPIGALFGGLVSTFSYYILQIEQGNGKRRINNMLIFDSTLHLNNETLNNVAAVLTKNNLTLFSVDSNSGI